MWPRRVELLALAPLLAPHEVMITQQWWGGGDADHASSWAGKHGGEAVSGPSIVWA